MADREPGDEPYPRSARSILKSAMAHISGDATNDDIEWVDEDTRVTWYLLAHYAGLDF